MLLLHYRTVAVDAVLVFCHGIVIEMAIPKCYSTSELQSCNSELLYVSRKLGSSYLHCKNLFKE